VRVYKKKEPLDKYVNSYIENLARVLREISIDEISNFIDILIASRDRGSSIFFIGNGGSASTASHFANDLSIGTKLDNKPFKAFSLCDNQSIITAISNDYKYDDIFSRQLSILLKEDDVVVAISASGNSLNIINAINEAKSKGGITIGLTAFDGGIVRRISDYGIHIHTKNGEYGPSEDAHLIIDHMVSNYLMQLLKNN